MLTAAWRALRRAPLFATTVIVLVAALVAVNATAFSAIHALRWKALPYVQSDRLVDLRADMAGYGVVVGLSERLREPIDADRTVFAGALGYTVNQGKREDAQGRRWRFARVGQAFERVLGVAPALGRGFGADDMREGADKVLLLSDAAWRREYAGATDVVGRELRFEDDRYTIIGVMPPGFVFPTASVDAWRPYVMTTDERAQSDGGNVGHVDVVARLAGGVGIEPARARLQAVMDAEPSVAGLRQNAGLRADVRPWRDRFAGTHGRALTVLQLAALVLLAVVAANLVNLHLDRLLGRAREFGIRRALGADEHAITRGIVGDLALPVVVGLVGGLALAPFGTAIALRTGLLPENLPQGSGFGVAAVVAGGLVALVAFGSAAVAAWIVRRPARLSARAGIGGLGRVRPAMIVAQVMLTTILLGTSGLLLRSALNLMATPRGFDAHGIVLTAVDPAGVSISGRKYDPASDDARLRPLVEQVRADIAALPGVRAIAIAMAPPFSQWEYVSGYTIPGQEEPVQARARGVGPGYFGVLDIPLVAGRGFAEGDPHDGVVVVDEVWARRHAGGANPVGSRLQIPRSEGPPLDVEVIGVAATVKHERLDETDPLPTVYQHVAAPLPVFWLVTRVDGEPADYPMTIARRVAALVPGVDIGINQPLEKIIGETLAGDRAVVAAVGAFALATLALAALGLAAVLGFAIRRRTAEIGVRLAVGATPARVRALVLRQGGGLVAVGLALGVLAGVPLARLLGGHLHGIGMADPPTWAGVIALIATIALAACWLPAHRAARTDPVEALRRE